MFSIQNCRDVKKYGCVLKKNKNMNCPHECVKAWSDFDDCSEKAIRENLEAKARECMGQQDLLGCMNIRGAVAAGFEGCQSGIPHRVAGARAIQMSKKEKDWAIVGGVAVAVVVVLGVGYYFYSRK